MLEETDAINQRINAASESGRVVLGVPNEERNSKRYKFKYHDHILLFQCYI